MNESKDPLMSDVVLTFCCCVASSTSLVRITSWSLSLISCSTTATRVCSWLTRRSLSWHSVSRLLFSLLRDRTCCFDLWHSWTDNTKLCRQVFLWLSERILLNKYRTSSRLASLALRSRMVESLLYFLSVSSLLAVSSSETLVWSCWVLLWWDDSSSCRSCSFCCCRRACV